MIFIFRQLSLYTLMETWQIAGLKDWKLCVQNPRVEGPIIFNVQLYFLSIFVNKTRITNGNDLSCHTSFAWIHWKMHWKRQHFNVNLQKLVVLDEKLILSLLYEPRHKKSCLRVLRLWPAQLQKLDRVEILDRASRGITLSRQRTTKVLIRLRGCAAWSAPLLFAYGINRFSHDMVHIMYYL